MKRKQTQLLMLLLLTVLIARPASAQKPSNGDVSNLKAQPSEAGVAVSNASEGLRVSVTADSWVGSFVTYRSGENFVVVVPQAKTSAIRWNLNGQGLSGVQVDQRGDDVVVLLRVSSGNQPS